jgi:2-keto-4-pentenoate hydratase/2-oxohepta-3-ene-1,7-dioic acid hydratase in catechol pathway
MHLVSLLGDSEPGDVRLGVEVGGRVLATADIASDLPSTMAGLLGDVEGGLSKIARAIDSALIERDGAPLKDVRLSAPVPHPGKIVAVGRNYPDHSLEEGSIPPAVPLVFAKFPSAVVGHEQEISWNPDLTSEVDWEAELGVVIGRSARRVGENEALDYVLGYTVVNDVSARDIQVLDKQWVRAKSLDTFAPMGPVLVTRDEIANPDDLRISCQVNGEEMQSDRTSSMFYSIRKIISFCSASFTLHPGDVIATGTPGGVGAFRHPPIFLHDGDVVSVTIECIGTLTNTCREEKPA